MTPPTDKDAARDLDPSPNSSWLLVKRAAADDGDGRARFAMHYLPVIQAYLGARWAGGPLRSRVDDAVQDVFLECYREGGAIETADVRRATPFRAFLFGVIRNVAMRCEADLQRDQRQSPASTMFLQGIPGREASLSRVFDEAWARSLMLQARELQNQLASQKSGPEAEAAAREIEVLELRFQRGLPIREIAAEWQMDAESVHRLYSRARSTFRNCLCSVVRAQTGAGPSENVNLECQRLFDLIGE